MNQERMTETKPEEFKSPTIGERMRELREVATLTGQTIEFKGVNSLSFIPVYPEKTDLDPPEKRNTPESKDPRELILGDSQSLCKPLTPALGER